MEDVGEKYIYQLPKILIYIYQSTENPPPHNPDNYHDNYYYNKTIIDS